MKMIVSLGIPLAFTLLMVRGLWNYTGGVPKFYFYVSMAAPFLIIIFCGLFRIINAIIEWIKYRFGAQR